VLNVLTIEVRHQIKVLGLIFVMKLSWYPQVMTAIERANKIKQGLRLVGKYFTKEEMVKISTNLFYSRLYHVGLSAVIKKKLCQASSRRYRIAQKEWNCEKFFDELHKITERATPKMWSNYVQCCVLFDVVITLLCKLMENNLVEQR
jgi:hypothetical protein